MITVVCAGTLGVGDFVRCRYHGGPIFYIAQVEGVTWGDPVPYAPEHRYVRKREGCEEYFWRIVFKDVAL